MKITKDSQDLVVIENKPGLFEYVLSIASIFLIYTLFEILLLTPEDKKNLLGAAFGCIFIISALALSMNKMNSNSILFRGSCPGKGIDFIKRQRACYFFII